MKNSKKGYNDLLLLLNMLDCKNNDLYIDNWTVLVDGKYKMNKAEIAKLKTQCYSKCDLSW